MIGDLRIRSPSTYLHMHYKYTRELKLNSGYG